jgi:hypothetical protein
VPQVLPQAQATPQQPRSGERRDLGGPYTRGKEGVEPTWYRADHPGVTTHIHLDYVRLLPFDAIRDFLKSIAGCVCYNSLGKEYFQAHQAIDHAMTEALWRSNHLDVEDYRLPDIGEINLRLNGIASEYLESRDNLRKARTGASIAPP